MAELPSGATVPASLKWASTTSQIGGPSVSSLTEAQPATTYSRDASIGSPVARCVIAPIRSPIGARTSRR